MRNSTGPSITAKVCPWLFTCHRRSPRSFNFINSASSCLSFSCCPHFRRVHSAAPWMPLSESLRYRSRSLPINGSRSPGDSPSVPYVPSVRISARRIEVSG